MNFRVPRESLAWFSSGICIENGYGALYSLMGIVHRRNESLDSKGGNSL